MRLSNQTREQIINAVAEKTVNARIGGLKARETALAEAVYQRVVGDNGQAILAMPEGWFVETNLLKLFIRPQGKGHKVTGVHMMDNHGRRDYQLELPTARRMPHNACINGIYLNYGDELAAAALQLMDEHKRMWLEIKTLREEVRTMVCNCSTSDKLLEEWPEAEIYLPEVKPQAKRIEVTGDSLNVRIGNITVAPI